jgi:hypothetical protein
MLQDILSVLLYPRDNIFEDPLLAPSPLFATLTALPAVLVVCQEFSTGNHMLKYLIDILFLTLCFVHCTSLFDF